MNPRQLESLIFSGQAEQALSWLATAPVQAVPHADRERLAELAALLGRADLQLRWLPAAALPRTPVAEPRSHEPDAMVPPSDDERALLIRLQNPAPADLERFILTFSGREDHHARQWFDERKGGGYNPVPSPLTPDLVRAHLLGTMTLGTYPLRTDGTVRFLALDFDMTKAARGAATGFPDRVLQLRRDVTAAAQRALRGLHAIGLDACLEESGQKGWHLWVFFDRPLPAALAHELGTGAMAAFEPLSRDVSVECFPKQSALAKGGLGNLIKLPLGVHRVTGRRALFVDPNLRPYADPWQLLRTAKRHNEAQVNDALQRLPAPPPRPTWTPGPNGTGEAPLPAPPTANPLDLALAASASAMANHPRQPFTAKSLEEHPVISRILTGCAVLRAIAAQAQTERYLAHDQRIVLSHALGGLDGGVDAVNFLLGCCPETPDFERLKRPLRGHPISCPNIRKRVPTTAMRTGCNCTFNLPDGLYPTPSLHSVPGAAEPGQPPKPVFAPGPPPWQEEPAATSARVTQADDELLLQALLRLPGNRLPVAGGVWKLVRSGERNLAVFISETEETG
jgi:hypothetical protein